MEMNDIFVPRPGHLVVAEGRHVALLACFTQVPTLDIQIGVALGGPQEPCRREPYDSKGENRHETHDYAVEKCRRQSRVAVLWAFNRMRLIRLEVELGAQFVFACLNGNLICASEHSVQNAPAPQTNPINVERYCTNSTVHVRPTAPFLPLATVRPWKASYKNHDDSTAQYRKKWSRRRSESGPPRGFTTQWATLST